MKKGAPRQAVQAVDAAPFGSVMTSDPARLEGTKAGRLEEFPEPERSKKGGHRSSRVYACFGGSLF